MCLSHVKEGKTDHEDGKEQGKEQGKEGGEEKGKRTRRKERRQGIRKKENMSATLSLSLVQGGKPDLNTALPIRQTASIFKQPVTKVTSHPGNKVKTDLQRATEQPRQVRG